MAKSVRASNGAFANVAGTEAAQALFAKLPTAMTAKVQAALDAGAAQIVEDYKATAPVAPEFERHPGQLRDSAHVEESGRALSVSVVVDAEDAKGHAYAAHVEFGHKTPEGGHVPAKPALYPAYRKNKRKLSQAVSAAIKATAAGQAT